MSNNDPQDIAISVLTWLAGEPELLGRFLALSGLEASNLRQAAQEPGFMAGVLNFLMSHEPTLVQFCQATNTRPEYISRAFNILSGENRDLA